MNKAVLFHEMRITSLRSLSLRTNVVKFSQESIRLSCWEEYSFWNSLDNVKVKLIRYAMDFVFKIN